MYGNPWFIRSARYSYGSGAGLFAYFYDYGSAGPWYSFRNTTMTKKKINK